MNDEQRRLAHFGVQPEGTGPVFRLPALQLTCVRRVHGDRCASAVEKPAAVAATSIVLTGPRETPVLQSDIHAGRHSIAFTQWRFFVLLPPYATIRRKDAAYFIYGFRKSETRPALTNFGAIIRQNFESSRSQICMPSGHHPAP